MEAQSSNQVALSTVRKLSSLVWDLTDYIVEKECEVSKNIETNKIGTEDFEDMFKKIDGFIDVDVSDVASLLGVNNDGGYAALIVEEIFIHA